MIFLDEDVPGGGTAYMLQQVMEKQEIFRYLDREPLLQKNIVVHLAAMVTISANQVQKMLLISSIN